MPFCSAKRKINMKKVIANITSYIGISADAEHYYCKYEVFDNQVEFLNHVHSYDEVAVYGDKELRYYPTEGEALAMVKKDCGDKISYMQVADYINHGTIRFPDIHSITRELHKQFPDSEIVIAENESVKEYMNSYLHEEYYILFDELTKEQQEKLINLFVGNDFDRYNDTWKRIYFLCHIFKNKKEVVFVELCEELKKGNDIEQFRKDI